MENNILSDNGKFEEYVTNVLDIRRMELCLNFF